jgi:hypothetical protein
MGDIRKALDIAAAGSALIPEEVSEGIRMFIERRTSIYNLIPKIDWDTNTYIHRAVTGAPSASFLGDGGNLPARTTGTYAKRSSAIKYLYTTGEVTRPMQLAARTVLDALATEIELHTLAMLRTLEIKVISGDSGVDPLEFDGLAKQITTEVDADGAGPAVLLQLAHLDELYDAPPEQPPSHYILSMAMGRRVWSLLQAQQRFVNEDQVGGGFRVPSYNGIPLIRTRDNSAALTNTVLAPDMEYVVMPRQSDITYEPLAKTKDSFDFMLSMYIGLAVEGPERYHAFLSGVKDS